MSLVFPQQPQCKAPHPFMYSPAALNLPRYALRPSRLQKRSDEKRRNNYPPSRPKPLALRNTLGPPRDFEPLTPSYVIFYGRPLIGTATPSLSVQFLGDR